MTITLETSREGRKEIRKLNLELEDDRKSLENLWNESIERARRTMK